DPEPIVLPGVVFDLRRKCGKPGCHCATGEPHATPALAYPEGGRTKTLTLANADLAEVRAAVARYQAARAELDRAARAGVEALRAEMAARRGRRVR
ncbi:MAG: DUF6788 family protein, partial [Acidimicrobiales bacterium]